MKPEDWALVEKLRRPWAIQYTYIALESYSKKQHAERVPVPLCSFLGHPNLAKGDVCPSCGKAL